MPVRTSRVMKSDSPRARGRALRVHAFALAATAAMLAPSAAEAQVVSRLSLRGELGSGLMISSLQR